MNRERLYPRRTNFAPALGRCKLCSYSPIINTSSHEPSKVGNRCECRGVSAEMQKAKCVNSQDNENKQAARTNKMNGVRGWAKRQIKIIKKKKINIIIKITHSPAQGKKSESRETKKKKQRELIDWFIKCLPWQCQGVHGRGRGFLQSEKGVWLAGGSCGMALSISLSATVARLWFDRQTDSKTCAATVGTKGRGPSRGFFGRGVGGLRGQALLAASTACRRLCMRVIPQASSPERERWSELNWIGAKWSGARDRRRRRCVGVPISCRCLCAFVCVCVPATRSTFYFPSNKSIFRTTKNENEKRTSGAEVDASIETGVSRTAFG